MNDSKDFLQSKTTWASILFLAQPVLMSLGINVDTPAVVDIIVNIISGGLFLWGQFSRKSKIGTVAGIKIPEALT